MVNVVNIVIRFFFVATICNDQMETIWSWQFSNICWYLCYLWSKTFSILKLIDCLIYKVKYLEIFFFLNGTIKSVTKRFIQLMHVFFEISLERNYLNCIFSFISCRATWRNRTPPNTLMRCSSKREARFIRQL